MQQTKKFYQKTTKGKITEFTLSVDEDRITSRWGQLDSLKMQEKVAKIQSKGKEGSRSFKSPSEQAAIEFDREVKKRFEHGYFETLEEAKSVDYSADIDLDDIPRSFSPAKPIQIKPCENPDDDPKDHRLNKALRKIQEEGNLLAQRKANGIRSYYVKTAKSSKLFSRSMVDMTEHFPLVMQELNCLKIPYGSMLDFELTIGGGYTYEQCQLIQGLAPNDNSKDPEKNAAEARKRFEEEFNKTQIPIVCCLFDVIYWDGECVYRNKTYMERYGIVKDLVNNI